MNPDPLALDYEWLRQAIELAIHAYFHAAAPTRPAPPSFPDAESSPYARFLARHALDEEDRIILLLALAPDLRPGALDPFLIRSANTDRPFAEFGGVFPPEGGYLPSVGTALFLLSGADAARRLEQLKRFDPAARLFREGWLAAPDRTGARAALTPGRGLWRELASMAPAPPAFGPEFPARRLETRLTWDDLILSPRCLSEVESLLAWIAHGPTLLARPTGGRLFEPGFRALFCGPSGVGKTLTAALIGQRCRRPVYRVDLSLVVSKWIGETEKNLALLFDLAEGRDWILFFDEADALFGKRSEAGHANDRYANQELSYLLQRIETFDGIAILATNLKKNIDAAFVRRFQAVVRFEPPGPAERQRLWRNALSEPGLVDPALDYAALARDYELTGAAIVNALRRALVAAAQRSEAGVGESLLRAAVERELVETGGDGLR